MRELFHWMPIALPILILALIWIPIFYLRSSDHRQHQRRWRDLAKLSGFSYHTPKDFARGIRKVGGVDAPNLGAVQQAISGQLNGCWLAVVESVVRKHSVRSAVNLNLLGERTSVAFCVLVVPTLQLPEFCLCKRSGRGITAALNGLLESSVELEAPFTHEYYLRGTSATALQHVFDEWTQRW